MECSEDYAVDSSESALSLVDNKRGSKSSGVTIEVEHAYATNTDTVSQEEDPLKLPEIKTEIKMEHIEIKQEETESHQPEYWPETNYDENMDTSLCNVPLSSSVSAYCEKYIPFNVESIPKDVYMELQDKYKLTGKKKYPGECEMSCKLETEFVKGSSDNLPQVDSWMVTDYFTTNINYVNAGIEHSKTKRSTRQTYGDNAIGYVQIRREEDTCYLQAKVTSENELNKKNYGVLCNIDESIPSIKAVQCIDCPAPKEGCQHAIAFMMWLHRRSEEPPPMESVCYWKRSILDEIPATEKFITTSDFGGENINFSNDNTFLNEYIIEAKKRKVDNFIVRCHDNIEDEFYSLSLHILKINFTSSVNKQDPYTFINFCKQRMTDGLLKTMEVNTRNRNKSRLLLEMRYGRITSSKAYEAIKCTTDENLEDIISGTEIFQSEALKRKLKLKDAVLNVLSCETSMEYEKSGIFLSNVHPFSGATPDAINNEVVVEIKCPKSQKTLKNYFNTEGDIKPKYMYKIQMQMHFAKKNRAIFAVAQPDFDTTKKIIFKYYDYDEQFVSTLLEQINDFWCKNVYNKL